MISRSDVYKKIYLGDGVYSKYNGDHIILTTENEWCVTNKILLDPQVILELMAQIKMISQYSKLRRDDADDMDIDNNWGGT